MKMIALTVLGVVTVAIVAVGEEQYTSRWDNIDVKPILNNKRLLNSYFRCVMDQGKCSPDGEELKKNIPDALENQCSKCTEKQKQNVNEVMEHLYNKQPEMFSQMEKKYDPEGKYRQKYSEEAKKRGIPVKS